MCVMFHGPNIFFGETYLCGMWKISGASQIALHHE